MEKMQLFCARKLKFNRLNTRHAFFTVRNFNSNFKVTKYLWLRNFERYVTRVNYGCLPCRAYTALRGRAGRAQPSIGGGGMSGVRWGTEGGREGKSGEAGQMRQAEHREMAPALIVVNYSEWYEKLNYQVSVTSTVSASECPGISEVTSEHTIMVNGIHIAGTKTCGWGFNSEVRTLTCGKSWKYLVMRVRESSRWRHSEYLWIFGQNGGWSGQP